MPLLLYRVVRAAPRRWVAQSHHVARDGILPEVATEDEEELNFEGVARHLLHPLPQSLSLPKKR